MGDLQCVCVWEKVCVECWEGLNLSENSVHLQSLGPLESFLDPRDPNLLPPTGPAPITDICYPGKLELRGPTSGLFSLSLVPIFVSCPASLPPTLTPRQAAPNLPRFSHPELGQQQKGDPGWEP